MTISAPYPDPAGRHKRSPDWLVTVLDGDRVDVHRFARLENAQAFSDQWQDETPDDVDDVEGVRESSSR